MNKKSQKTLFVITVHTENYRNNLFFDEVRRGINIEANLQGVNVEFLFGFSHSLEIFGDALGIIFAPDGSATCKDFINNIKARHSIPIVQIDNRITDAKYAPSFDAFIGVDNAHGGIVTAEYLKSFLPSHSKILVIAGNEQLKFLSYNLRLDGFNKESDGYFDTVGIVYGEFDHQLVYKRTHDYFTKGGVIPDAIFAFNDDSAIVAKKVLDEVGITQKILVAGFDGSAAGRVALSKGQIICSYDQDPENLGRKAFQIFMHIVEQRKFEKINLVRSTLLTRKNIGNTFYAGVINFLDRTLTPFSFRKRRYELCATSHAPIKQISDYRNELVCPIFIGNKEELPQLLKQIDADKFILVSDNSSFLEAERESIANHLRKSGLVIDSASFQAGEKNKNPKTLVKLIDDILRDKISKKSCLVLLGGGITGNVGGLTASLLYRGVRFVHVPTTLMHMVDSSTGGKQAVDTKYGKNTIGSFFEPEFIFIDHRYSQTLSEREIRNGLAECIKHALCQDEKFYTFILNNSETLLKKEITTHSRLVEETVKLKLAILDKDSYELNEGMVLVYGHTIGNALESASHYKLTHGEAISIGMVAAAKISKELGIASDDLVTKHIAIFEKIGLPTRIPKELSREAILEFLKYDKKYVDKPMTFVLLTHVGKIYMKEGIVPKQVEPDIVKGVIDSLY